MLPFLHCIPRYRLATVYTSIYRYVSTGNSNVLVLNCGSSSVKFQVLDPHTKEALISGQADRLNTPEGKLTWKKQGTKQSVPLPSPSYSEAIERVCHLADTTQFSMVGHRVVHGGHQYDTATHITPTILSELAQLDCLAPLHNPRQRKAMEITLERYQDKPQAAVFDTAWHSTLPQFSHLYGLPYSWYTDHHVRRYGFHGVSHQYVVQEVITRMGLKENLRIVSCHLGAGCSVAASRGGISMDTSMGFSPLEGLIMGQRAGDMDPSILQYMSDRLNVSMKEVLRMVGEEAGFLGMAATTDSKELEDRYLDGDTRAELVIDMFCYRVAKYVASYVVPLGGLDAIVFTGGIGEKSSIKRKKILDLLQPLGILYEEKNNEQHGKNTQGRLGVEGAGPQVWVIPTNEEWMIASQTKDLFSK